MDDSLGGMFKLTGSNYFVWKSKMRDMLVVKDLWLSVQFGDEKLDKIDAAIWEVMHMKTTTYIRCFIDMSLYNNFNEESQAHEQECRQSGFGFPEASEASVPRWLQHGGAHECLPRVDTPRR